MRRTRSGRGGWVGSPGVVDVGGRSARVGVKISFVITLTATVVNVGFLGNVGLFAPTGRCCLAFRGVRNLIPSGNMFVGKRGINRMHAVGCSFAGTGSFIISVTVGSSVGLPVKARTFLFSRDLVNNGNVGVMFRPDGNATFRSANSALPSLMTGNLLTAINSLIPSLRGTMGRVSSLLISTSSLVGSPTVHSSLGGVRSIAGGLGCAAIHLGDLVSGSTGHVLGGISSLAGSVSFVATRLGSIRCRSVFRSVSASLCRLGIFARGIGSPSKDVNLLLGSAGLCSGLSDATTDTSSLLVSLGTGPGHCIRFSLFNEGRGGGGG